MSKFVWFEYVSDDATTAQGFFGELFGWGAKKVPMPQGEYTMIAQGDGTIGGYSEPLPGAPEQAQWLSHLGVTDAKATAAKAKSLGGKVLVDAFAAGEFGTMAVIADPHGGVVALWQSADQSGGPAEGDYRFCWNELYSKDAKASVAFYRAIGNLGEQDMPMGGLPYTLLVDGEMPIAGICPPPMPGAPHAWLPVVAVPNADATLAKAQKLGATILAPIEDVPTIGRYFIIADPQGAALGILQRAKA